MWDRFGRERIDFREDAENFGAGMPRNGIGVFLAAGADQNDAAQGKAAVAQRFDRQQGVVDGAERAPSGTRRPPAPSTTRGPSPSGKVKSERAMAMPSRLAAASGERGARRMWRGGWMRDGGRAARRATVSVSAGSSAMPVWMGFQ
jgi:hypothetical protein